MRRLIAASMSERPVRHLLRLTSALALLFTAGAGSPNSDTLWTIVHDRCVPGQSHGDPSPCVLVEPAYAVLKDLKGVGQFLLIPTARTSGIDDPVVVQPEAGRLFEAAWRARGFLEAKLGRTLPRDDVSLAVNSVDARTQEQLHIHINCVRPDVRNALRVHVDEIGADWAPLRFPLAGHSYSAIRIEGETLADRNPFVLVEQHIGSIEAMKTHALVVIGSERDDRPGFVVLERGGEAVHGTELQDLSCSGPLGANAANEAAPK